MSFIDDRRAIVFKDGELLVQPEHDTRRGKAWCMEDLHFSEQEWAAATRGYISANRIVFFRGENYEADDRVTATEVRMAREKHFTLYGYGVGMNIYNGVIPAEPDTVWKGILRFNRTEKVWESVD